MIHQYEFSEAARWQLIPETTLHWYSWDSEFIVYNSASGDVHLLDQVSAETLKILETESANLSKLVDMVSESLKIEPDGKLTAYLEKLLSKLANLGLIECIRR